MRNLELAETLENFKEECYEQIRALRNEMFINLFTLWKEGIDRIPQIITKERGVKTSEEEPFLKVKSEVITRLMVKFKSDDKEFTDQEKKILRRYEKFRKIQKIEEEVQTVNRVIKGL